MQNGISSNFITNGIVARYTRKCFDNTVNCNIEWRIILLETMRKDADWFNNMVGRKNKFEFR